MDKKLIPTWHCKNVYSIDTSKLVDLNCKLIFCDIDNTLVGPYQPLPTKTTLDFVKKITQSNIKLVLISNNHEERVKTFASALNVDYLFEVKKPKTEKIDFYIKKNQLNKDEIIFIGDQIMTDILCASRLNIKSILVDRLTKKDQPITFFPRRLDIIIRYILKKKNLLVEF